MITERYGACLWHRAGIKLHWCTIVHPRGISMSEFPKMFCQTRKCQSNWQKANDKFLRINAWQESMKRLLTFTLLQSRVKRLEMVIFTSSTFPCPFCGQKIDIFKEKEIPSVPEERSRPSLSKENHTLCFFAYVSSWLWLQNSLYLSFEL